MFSLDNVSLPVSACQILLATGKPTVFTARKKVMFSEAYVSPSFHGGGGGLNPERFCIGRGYLHPVVGVHPGWGLGRPPRVCLQGGLH